MLACLDEELTLGYLRGQLSPETLDEVEVHLDSCDSCQQLIRLCARAADAEIAADGPTLPATRAVATPGALVGRFVVGERLGLGGMGVVYSAFDPQLERKVALKFLSPNALPDSSAAESAPRLLEEARAMAQLAHPNVVTVHDVGVAGEDVFVAMELVEGRTLTVWLGERRRSWRELRDAFVQAGRGLAAAHQAGIVHGDFKPDNVIVGVDGRVRVLDFGLAHKMASGGPAGMRGTPGYIAPEQLRGQPADARSDQFSFGVALWLAFHRELPPVSAAASERGGRQIRGQRRRRVAPPRWLKRVVERALQPAPEARHSSVAAMVDALERDPWQRPRRAVMTAAVVASFAAGLWGVQRARRSAELCGGAAHLLAGVWDPARRESVTRAFAATGLPYAADSARAVTAALDAYAAAWSAAHREACQATEVRHERSEQLLDQSMDCLDRRLRSLDALASALAGADSAVVAKSVHAAGELPAAAECGNPAAMEGRERRPTDAASRQKLASVEAGLARGATLDALGKFDDGLKLATALADEAAALGTPTVRADALILLGRLQIDDGQTDRAESTLREAVREATAAGSDHRAARALIEEVMTSNHNERFAEAVERARDADAVLARLGGDADLGARLDYRRGLAFEMLGRYDDAEQAERRALGFFESKQGREYREQTAQLLGSLGSLASDRGQYPEAIALHTRALSLFESLLGKEHPQLVSQLSKLGNALNNAGRYEEARVVFTRALRLADKSLPPNHPLTAEALEMLATSLVNLKRPGEAVGYAERALTIHEHSVPPNGRMAGYCNGVLAEAFRLQGKLDRALLHAQRSVTLMEGPQGPKSDDVGEQLTVVGRVLLEQKNWGEAAKVEARAAQIFEQGGLGEKHPDLPAALTELGTALLGGGEARRAAQVLARADGLREQAHATEAERAGVRWVWGKALWQLGGDRQAALAKIKTACAGFAQDPTAHEEVVECAAWLAGHKVR